MIGLTAHALVGDRAKGLQAGCDDYDTKPVDLPRLLAKIETLLRRRGQPMTTPAPALLLVDDEELNRDMLGRRLELHGYRVTLAEDGGSALEWSGSESFDLVLLDVMMPDLNGFQVLSRVRETRSAIRTAGHHGDGQEPEHRRRRGAFAWVPTTISPSRSISRWRLARICDSRRPSPGLDGPSRE